MAQLDRIAAQNLRAPAHGLGSTATLLAWIGGLVVLGAASMWSGTSSEELREPEKTVLAESRPLPAVVAAMAPAVTKEAAAPVVAGTPEPTPHAVAAAEAATFALAAAEPVADDAARKARAKQQAEARRKAAQLAQERALAEEAQRLQLAQQQRDAERAQQQQLLAEQARQRLAAEQARLQSVQLALDTHRSVGESCAASGSVISRQFCRARECSKAEHHTDPTCVTLRADEMARQRASIDR